MNESIALFFHESRRILVLHSEEQLEQWSLVSHHTFLPPRRGAVITMRSSFAVEFIACPALPSFNDEPLPR